MFEAFLTEYGKYVLIEEKWIQTLNEIKVYIDENDKRPSAEDKDLYVKYLGQWLAKQLTLYKKEKQGVWNNTECKKLFEAFLKEYGKYFLTDEEKWIQTLNEIKVYIEENDKRPTEREKDPRVKFLGTWLNSQISSYKKRNIKSGITQNVNNCLKRF